MKLTNMKIGSRLGASFGLLLLLLVGLTVLGIGGMRSIQDALRNIADENNTELRAANAIRVSAFERALTVRNLHIAALTDDKADAKNEADAKEREDRIKKETERVSKERARFAAAVKTLAGIYAPQPDQTVKERELLGKLADLDTITLKLETSLFDAMLKQKGFDATFTIIKDVRNQLRSSMVAAVELTELIEKQNAQALVDANAAYARARSMMLALSALAVAVGALLAWLATHSITRPINEAVAVAHTVSGGDLAVEIEIKRADETGQLMKSLKDMADSLSGIVDQVRGATGAIVEASGEIANGNLELSARTEQQASSLEETAASMEELTSTVRQNADNAHQADQLVATASAVALRGTAVVEEVVRTMGSINDSARKIVDIIGVIDGIAFQTNILALNAAVEAARAGEQGRGFAVVASEVRNLAQRSAAAAKEIKGLIDDSVSKVDAGNKLVGQAGTTMGEVAASVKRVSDIMGEITLASQEQRAGIEQVNQAIVEMDQATQQNAALVEKASAAAQSMREQAAVLTRSVSLFKLSGQAAAAPAPARGAPVAPRSALAVRARQPAKARLAAAPKPAATEANWEEF
ncbi:MAG TPA: methyl-accepting chemotaxis protein [Telluria sp.]|nr:methyl-accepting chemotaxis protein [Telluria sp.]